MDLIFVVGRVVFIIAISLAVSVAVYYVRYFWLQTKRDHAMGFPLHPFMKWIAIMVGGFFGLCLSVVLGAILLIGYQTRAHDNRPRPAVVQNAMFTGGATGPARAAQERVSDTSFEIFASESAAIHFSRANGTKCGAIIRYLEGNGKTVVALPNDEEVSAIVFPLRSDSDCRFKNSKTGGTLKPCKRIGTIRIGEEVLGVGFARYDEN